MSMHRGIHAYGHITKQVVNSTIASYGIQYLDEITIEYGDQFKVNAPADADDYVTVTSYTNLFS